MTRRRWIADEVRGDLAVLTGDHAFHLARVLRAQPGQEFDIVAENTLRLGRITSVADHRVEFALGSQVDSKPLMHLTLLLAVFKFDRMEWAIEKCTELGASRIVPVIARRTDKILAAAAVKRRDRWVRIAKQASEQARRAAPPEIAEPMRFKDAVSNPGKPRIVLEESEAQTHLREALEGQASDGGVTLAVGPEGGWTEDEIELFGSVGWILASLGPTILRAETAAIAATAITISAFC